MEDRSISATQGSNYIGYDITKDIRNMDAGIFYQVILLSRSRVRS
jgi:hypothetical protein